MQNSNLWAAHRSSSNHTKNATIFFGSLLQQWERTAHSEPHKQSFGFLTLNFFFGRQQKLHRGTGFLLHKF